ncbi:aminopeptidase P family N-terminal domain-containing protein, partial [uncultured Dubosiella sp.]
MTTIKERLDALRREMKAANVQAYIVPTSDFHDTEYVCDYFTARKYLSGFTGSAGTLVVCADQAALWTDGRYFIQAASQLEGTG